MHMTDKNINKCCNIADIMQCRQSKCCPLPLVEIAVPQYILLTSLFVTLYISTLFSGLSCKRHLDLHEMKNYVTNRISLCLVLFLFPSILHVIHTASMGTNDSTGLEFENSHIKVLTDRLID